VNTWVRCKGESKEAYAAFEIYYTLEPDERSLEAVSRKCGKSVSLLARWSALKKWVSRADDYDAHMASIRQKEREKQAARWEARREAMRQEQIEREIKHAEKLEGKAVAILDTLPIVRKYSKGDDGKVTIVAPASSAEYQAATRMLQTARDFMRGLLDMPTKTERTELTGKNGGAVKVAPTDLTGEKSYDVFNAEPDALKKWLGGFASAIATSVNAPSTGGAGHPDGASKIETTKSHEDSDV
jgi:hypothetical protein